MQEKLKYHWLIPFNLYECKKQWLKEPRRWGIHQWKDEFTLYRETLHKRPRISIKMKISEYYARLLIDDLNLVENKSYIFKVASNWKIEI